MSYLVLARKYRPQNFDDVVGQNHITDLLKKAVNNDRVAHAYLFCGPRGIGKTSCARILAKSLNCEKGPTVEPCGQCSACREIAAGNSFDVLEIDGASNRGIDEIRTLRENVKFAAGYGRYKVYIIDEVHMLTTEAFNALLKTLEEPPEHVKFIFATTDPNKVPPTILSRCQRFDFKRIPLTASVEALKDICDKESFRVEPEALYAIAKAAQGSFRDALSVLDQVSAISDRDIKGEDVYSMLGLVEVEMLFELSGHLASCSCPPALETLNAVIEKGKDIKQLTRDLLEHFRNLMVIKIGGKSLGKLVDYPVAIKEMYLKQSADFSLTAILKAVDLLVEAQEVARVTETQRAPLEIAFAKLTLSQTGEKTPRAETAPAGGKYSTGAILKEERGEARISNDPQSPPKAKPINKVAEQLAETPADETPPRLVEGELSLEKIRKSWSALTYGVSRKKMSIATFLQEGCPTAWKDDRLSVGFTEDLVFHKETLEGKENLLLVEEVFKDLLGQKILLDYHMMDVRPEENDDEVPEIVQSTLATFNGKIISQWHNE